MRRWLLALTALAIAALALPPLWYAAFPEPAPELPPPGRAVEIAPGTSVNLIEAGAGPAIVLVHGHPGCAYDWAPLQTELARRGHRAIAYDRVGYGRSDGRAPGRISVETNAAELVRLLAALELREVTLVGWSYGGGTSIVAAKRDPSRIARLALVGSVGPGVEERSAVPAPLIDFLAGPVLSWVSSVPPAARRLRAAMTTAAFHPDAVPDWFRTQLAANFARPHTLATFRSEGRDLGGEADLDPGPIELPILVIHGDEDRLVPLAVAETLHARAPGSDLRVIPRAGHMPPITHAALLADAIADFAAHGARQGRAPGAR
jgi:pimeloyl-ACP methyl ester carboxylesterase